LNKKIVLLSGFSALFLGVLLLCGIDINLGKAGKVTSSFNNIFIFMFIGFLCIYISRFVKNDIYKKCPKCKKSFANSELDKGMCPKCDVETEDIEEYYKKNKFKES